VPIDGEEVLSNQHWLYPALQDIVWARHKRSSGDTRIGVHAADSVTVDLHVLPRIAARYPYAEGLYISNADALRLRSHGAQRF
jgi:hypothetical protein